MGHALEAECEMMINELRLCGELIESSKTCFRFMTVQKQVFLLHLNIKNYK